MKTKNRLGMILFHFTTPENVPSILRDGLFAKNKNAHNDLTGFPVVWLTDVPTLELPLEVRRMWLRRGMLCGPGVRNLPLATVCLKVIIPTNDKRLKHFATWLRTHPQLGVDPTDPMLNPHNWFYRGTVMPDRLSAFKTVPPGVPYSILTDIHDAWKRGVEIAIDASLEADLLAGRAGPDDYVALNLSNRTISISPI
jgi:hypothetical protein